MTSVGTTCVPFPQGHIANEKWEKNRDFHEGHMFSFLPAHSLTEQGRASQVQPIFTLFSGKIGFNCLDM